MKRLFYSLLLLPIAMNASNAKKLQEIRTQKILSRVAQRVEREKAALFARHNAELKSDAEILPASEIINIHKIDKNLFELLRGKLLLEHSDIFHTLFNQLDDYQKHSLATMLTHVSKLNDSSSHTDDEDHSWATGKVQTIKEDYAIANRDLKQRKLIHYAAIFGDAKCVKTLLETGADPLALDAHQETPITYALINDNMANLEMLIAHMPNILAPIKKFQDKKTFSSIISAIAYNYGKEDADEQDLKRAVVTIEKIRTLLVQNPNKYPIARVIAAFQDAYNEMQDIDNVLGRQVLKWCESLQELEDAEKNNAIVNKKEATPALPRHDGAEIVAAMMEQHGKQKTKAKKPVAEILAEKEQAEAEREKRIAARAATCAELFPNSLKPKIDATPNDYQTEQKTTLETVQPEIDPSLLPPASEDPALQKLLAQAQYRASAEGRKGKAIQYIRREKKKDAQASAAAANESHENTQQDSQKKTRMEELDDQALQECYQTVAQKVLEQDEQKKAGEKRKKEIIKKWIKVSNTTTLCNRFINKCRAAATQRKNALIDELGTRIKPQKQSQTYSLF